jgi:hypothetical protein
MKTREAVANHLVIALGEQSFSNLWDVRRTDNVIESVVNNPHVIEFQYLQTPLAVTVELTAEGGIEMVQLRHDRRVIGNFTTFRDAVEAAKCITWARGLTAARGR